MEATLLLKDGFTMKGRVFTGEGEVFGEVVFNTGMTGYQEMATDPSYRSQILTYTYPLIGNYGCNPRHMESAVPRVEAVLVKQYCSRPHNWRSRESFGDFLAGHSIPGIEGIDTRKLTLHLRRSGTMSGVLSTLEQSDEELQKKLDNYPGIVGTDLVKHVTTDKPYTWDNKLNRPNHDFSPNLYDQSRHIVVIDLGVKYSILRALGRRGCQVSVVPANWPPEEILALQPKGVLLSNGPGDPSAIDYLQPTVLSLLGRVPMMGICLGHQLLGRTLGIDTFKLKFGHRGGNHPVKDLHTNKVCITVQNHGFNLSADSSLPEGTEITHINLNDNTLEGIENKKMRFFSVQFHPEAGPGPHDCTNLFDRFIALIGF